MRPDLHELHRLVHVLVQRGLHGQRRHVRRGERVRYQSGQLPRQCHLRQRRGLVCLHASAIAIGEHAIAVVGSAGSGKSTTAAAFSERGFRILAEDVVTLDDRGDQFLVRPAYPCIRLWPASVQALYGSESHLPKLTPNWDKCYLDLTDQFQRESLPLAAIYVLDERRDDSDAPFVVPLDRAEGLMALVANTYATKLMDKEMRAREFELLTRVLNNVPLRRVTPHTDPARIPELCDSILNDFGHSPCTALTSTAG